MLFMAAGMLDLLESIDFILSDFGKHKKKFVTLHIDHCQLS
jgi:hypothetical protein